ncbi:ras and EF-hand domain-containing protein homolog isoform X3 [Chelonus insularis]|uniref:ras and EF-hand domain-containing protein homolog isoform X3 n=1 Tax=Chelonus insularis TaxID=460826 RepID=UPI001589B938|nr:ras and EF-hand domain-containing protein homolog isoform X3 [Chelonus insularis]
MSQESSKEESSPDSVIARLSFTEDDDNYEEHDTSGEYITVAESNSSLDTLTLTEHVGVISHDGEDTSNEVEVLEDKKKGRFGNLKSTFRKEKGFFKTKKTSPSFETNSIGDIENAEPETSKSTSKLEESQVIESSVSSPQPSNPPVIKMMKKKKSGSIVRRLSLSKFRLGSSDSETRKTPEGGNSSRSSSIESSGHLDSPGKTSKKGHQQQQQLEEKSTEKTKGREKKMIRATTSSLERRNTGSWGQEREKGAAITSEKQIDDPRPRQKSDKQSSEKPISTVTVLQRRSPSVTIKTNFKDIQGEKSLKDGTLSKSVSTLPYTLSKWQDSKINKKPKLNIKSESESAIKSTPLEPTVEVRRKLSLLEEKRAIFQRKFFETSTLPSLKDSSSLDTVIVPDSESKYELSSDTFDTCLKKPSRHINVKTLDTFSTTFGATFDEESGFDYLDSFEEKDTRDLDQVIPMALGEASDMPRSLSGDSGSTHNSAPNTGVSEKREHLYKILVIGELGAGKTSIIKRYVHQFFSQHYRATIGVDFALKVLNWDPNTIIRLQLWDIAGQERFGNMTRVYYKEAVGAFIVFDVTRSATLDAVVKWKQDLDSKVQLPDGSPIPCVLLANKCDQQKEGLVNSPGKMDDYCKEKNFAGWFETSAKENINIEEAARFLVNRILQNDQMMKGNGAQDQVDGERFALNQSPTNSKKSCSC